MRDFLQDIELTPPWLIFWLLVGGAWVVGAFTASLWMVSIILLLGAIGARVIAARQFWTTTPFDAGLIVLTVAAIASAGAALYSAGDRADTWAQLVVCLLGVLVIQALRAVPQGKVAGVAYWWLFGVAGVGLSLVSIVSTRLPAKQPGFSAIARRIPLLLDQLPGIDGGFHPNIIAGSLLWFVPIPIAALFALWADSSAEKWRRPATGLLASGAVVIWFTFLLMQSRGALLGAIVATCALFMLRGGIARWVGGAVIAALLALVVFVNLGALRGSFTSAMLQELTGDFELEFRTQLWTIAYQMTHDFLFTGIGLGQFDVYGPALYLFPLRPISTMGHAHNFFLHTGAEMGLFAVIGSAVMWLTAFWLLWRDRNSADSLQPFRLAALWSWVAFTIYGMMDTVALGSAPSLFWWIFLGLVLIVTDEPSAQRRK